MFIYFIERNIISNINQNAGKKLRKNSIMTEKMSYLSGFDNSTSGQIQSHVTGKIERSS